MIYVRNLDEVMTVYNTYAEVEQMPENWRIPCMMLDAAQNENGMAQVNHVGHRMQFKGHTYYHMSKIWKFVYMQWYHDKFNPRVSNEHDPATANTTNTKLVFGSKKYGAPWI